MKSLIRTAPAVALAAVGVALAFPSIASALPDTPGEWDLGAYEGCLASGEGQLPDKPNAAEDHDHYCCINSGGIWDATAKKCVAPPAEPAEAPITKATPKAPVQVFEPVRPTTTRVPGGVFVQTLTVAP